MTVHLLKLCVGADSLDDLLAWRDTCLKRAKAAGARPHMPHVTRMQPKRGAEILDGGSLYWVIRGVVQARQTVRDLEEVYGEDGVRRCRIVLDPEIVCTETQPRRAFQGWRYLAPEDAPGDVGAARKGDAPAALRAELAALGLL